MFDIVLVFLLLIAFKTAVFLILEGLNLRYLTWMSAAERALPESVRGIMDDATFARSVDYTRAKSQFSSVSALYDALVLVLILSLVLSHGSITCSVEFSDMGSSGSRLFLSSHFSFLDCPVCPLIGGIPLNWKRLLALIKAALNCGFRIKSRACS